MAKLFQHLLNEFQLPPTSIQIPNNSNTIQFYVKTNISESIY